METSIKTKRSFFFIIYSDSKIAHNQGPDGIVKS